MKNRNLLMLLAIFCYLISGCTAEGLTGPEGPAGPIGVTGEKGDAGPIGAAGKDGSIIYGGTGTPSNVTGNTGDYYLDRSTGNLYGPKNETGWGAPLLLMGATGAAGSTGAAGTNGTNGADGTNGTNGKDGSKTLSGIDAPDIALGNPGDYYLNRTSYLLYGPKNADGWGIPILLRGAEGAQGPTGTAGKDGSIIYSGSGSPSSAIGITGDYYLNRVNGNLYGPKNGASWGDPIVLIGAAGKDGTNGTNGTNGKNGSTTISGIAAPTTAIGAIGDYYLKRNSALLYGPKNADGWGVPVLLRGADGAQGPAGPAGANGSVIYSGNNAPDPALGKIGDFYFGKNITSMFGPKTAAGWGTGTNLKGTSGTDGANGSNGVNGSSVLNGTGVPAAATGKPGDFYIDISSYNIYGPKTNAGWGSATSLKGANGNANVVALETPDNVTFSWSYEGSNRALRKQGVSFNDTSTVFNIPPANLTAAKNGVVLVYIRANAGGGSYVWKQLNFTDVSMGNNIFYKYILRVNTTDAKIRIIHNNMPDYTTLDVDKVRIVITPASSTGVLNSIRSTDQPMVKTMQNLGLSDRDFISLK